MTGERRFPAGLRGLVSALASIQAGGSSGRLEAQGGSLDFSGGLLIGAHDAAAPAGADLRLRAREILARAARAPEEVRFAPSPPSGSMKGLSALLNAGDLILDVVNAAADPAFVRAQLGGLSRRPGPNPAAPKLQPRLALSPADGFLLSRADGTLSVEEILKISPLDEDETLRSVYGLLASGLLAAGELEVADRDPALASAAATPADRPPSAAAKPSALDAFLQRTDAPVRAATRAGEATRPAATSDQLRERVVRRMAACKDVDHYRILGVDRSADEGTVRHAYYRLAKEFHPDRFRAPEFEEIFAEIERTFGITTDAYNVLTDPAARAEYDRALAEAAGGRNRGSDLDRPAQARDAYLRARKHLEADELFDALKLLETATEMDPSKHDYWYYLGAVQTRNPKWRKKAESSLLKAIEMSPGHVQAHVQLARLYKAGGLARRAAEMYEKVLSWAPDHEEALEELGRKKAPGQPGGLRSLFKGTRS